MNPRAELLKAQGFMRPCGGLFSGGSKSSSSTSTTNTDNRTAVQDGVAISGSSGNITVNSPDAVKAVAQLGTEAIARTGAAVVELNQASLDANVTAWDKTVTAGAELVDKLIDASTTLGSQAINSFQPTENKQQDTLRVALIAGALALGAVTLFKAK